MVRPLGTNSFDARCAGGDAPQRHTVCKKLLWFRATSGVALHTNYVSKSRIERFIEMIRVMFGYTE